MIRFAQVDYSRLREYFDAYRFTPDGCAGSSVAVKNIHRNTLCAMQVWAAFRQEIAGGNFIVDEGSLGAGSEGAILLDEFFSDVVSASFAAFHGLYKPAHMTLRSSIEVLVRGLASVKSDAALETTSVSKLFELAGGTGLFGGSSEIHFHAIKAEYGELCGFVHTATPGHLGRIYAFADFPIMDSTRLSQFARHHQKVIVAVLSIMIELNKRMYVGVPPRARDLLDEVIPAAVRIRALGG